MRLVNWFWIVTSTFMALYCVDVEQYDLGWFFTLILFINIANLSFIVAEKPSD